MTNNEILFAALVGTKVLEIKKRLDIVENRINKNVVPGINFLPLVTNQDTNVKSNENEITYNVWKDETSIAVDKQFFPLGLSYKQKDGTFSEFWYLPFEPMITIVGANTLTRKNVSKTNEALIPFFGATLEIPENKLPLGYSRGTVKTRLRPDDYVVTVTGMLVGKSLVGNPKDCYPVADLEKLQRIFESKSEIKISSFPLEKLGINYLAIENFSFPFTKGENMQAYNFTAFSDQPKTLEL